MSEDEWLLLVFCGAVPGLAAGAESICVRPPRGGAVVTAFSERVGIFE